MVCVDGDIKKDKYDIKLFHCTKESDIARNCLNMLIWTVNKQSNTGKDKLDISVATDTNLIRKESTEWNMVIGAGVSKNMVCDMNLIINIQTVKFILIYISEGHIVKLSDRDTVILHLASDNIHSDGNHIMLQNVY